MLDDGDAIAGFIAELETLHALFRVSQRMLAGAFCQRHALQADGYARVVHHRKHALESLAALADEIADSAAFLAIGHDAGGRAMNAELMLERYGLRVIALAGRS